MRKYLLFLKQNILLCGFLGLLLLPYPLWALLQGCVDTTNYENRTFAAFPDLTETSIAALPAALETWIEDNAPFRNQFMRLSATLNWAVGTLDSADVLLGENGWLFMKDSHDSSSLSDYQGLTSYTEAEQLEILVAVNTLAEQLAAYDCELVILFAPAKEGVYAEYMPDSIVVTGETRVEALVEYLTLGTAQVENASIVWPKEALQELATRQQVYYKYDTHWNEAGGWLAAQNVLEVLDMPFSSDDPNAHAAPEVRAQNDLANVSATWAFCNDDIYYALDEEIAAYTWVAENAYLMQFEGEGKGELLMIRDSFGEAMAGYLAAGFEKSSVVHGNLLKQDTLWVYNITMPDVVVIEVGERFSDNLLSRVNTMIELIPTLARE